MYDIRDKNLFLGDTCTEYLYYMKRHDWDVESHSVGDLHRGIIYEKISNGRGLCCNKKQGYLEIKCAGIGPRVAVSCCIITA
jgi:hypothetical protein